MSDERTCEKHGAVCVNWHIADIPDIDGEPRCYVCDIEGQLLKAKLEKSTLLIPNIEQLQAELKTSTIASMDSMAKFGKEISELQAELDAAKAENEELKEERVLRIKLISYFQKQRYDTDKLQAELDTANALLKDSPSPSDMDGLIFDIGLLNAKINRLEKENKRYREAINGALSCGNGTKL